MKKIFILFAIMFAFTMCVSMSANAQVPEKVASVAINTVDSVYHDGKVVVDSLYHDGKAVVGTVYKDTKAGLSNLYPDIKSAIMSIGHAIGVAAEHVYTVLVKKYFVLGVKQVCIFVFGLVMFIWGVFAWRKATPVGQPITYRVIVPSILIIVGALTMYNVNYDEMLMGIINPEYGAINYILDYTKELAK